MKVVPDLKAVVADATSWNDVARALNQKTITLRLRRLINELDINTEHLDAFWNGFHTKINKFSREELQAIVANSTKWSELLLNTGYYFPTKQFMNVVKAKLDIYGMDYSHIEVDNMRAMCSYTGYDLQDVLVENSSYCRQQLKRRLKKELGWKHECSFCHQTEWKKCDVTYPIPLEIDHINGVNNDNRLSNLRFLCPNCHAFTDTYRGKNIAHYKKKKELTTANTTSNTTNSSESRTPKSSKSRTTKPKRVYHCIDCNKVVNSGSERCCDCYCLRNRKVERPTLEQLKEDLQTMSMSQVGKKYGVTDNSIRKWLKNYNKTVNNEEALADLLFTTKMKRKVIETPAPPERIASTFDIDHQSIQQGKYIYTSHCIDCNAVIQKRSKRCIDCFRKKTRKVERPSYEQLREDIQSMSMIKVGEKYGVCDTTIRKWVENYLGS